eukprot:5225772-Amphidinium_carterae.1
MWRTKAHALPAKTTLARTGNSTTPASPHLQSYYVGTVPEKKRTVVERMAEQFLEEFFGRSTKRMVMMVPPTFL